MKWISGCARSAACVALFSLITHAAFAADIVNGWSPTATISNVYSMGFATMFKLTDTAQSCGHPDFWQLLLNDTTTSKTKHALLVAAFVSGKQVSLRCENSAVNNFQVFQ